MAFPFECRVGEIFVPILEASTVAGDPEMMTFGNKCLEHGIRPRLSKSRRRRRRRQKMNGPGFDRKKRECRHREGLGALRVIRGGWPNKRLEIR